MACGKLTAMQVKLPRYRWWWWTMLPAAFVVGLVVNKAMRQPDGMSAAAVEKRIELGMTYRQVNEIMNTAGWHTDFVPSGNWNLEGPFEWRDPGERTCISVLFDRDHRVTGRWLTCL
jgi:hypothetical protein